MARFLSLGGSQRGPADCDLRREVPARDAGLILDGEGTRGGHAPGRAGERESAQASRRLVGEVADLLLGRREYADAETLVGSSEERRVGKEVDPARDW